MTMTALLYDGRTGDLVWRQRLEQNHTLPRDTDSMAQAALESFAKVAGQLAMALRQLPVESFPPHQDAETQ